MGETGTAGAAALGARKYADGRFEEEVGRVQLSLELQWEIEVLAEQDGRQQQKQQKQRQQATTALETLDVD
jgi:hypothetical protein